MLAGPEAVAECDRDELRAKIGSAILVAIAVIVLAIGHFAFGWTI